MSYILSTTNLERMHPVKDKNSVPKRKSSRCLPKACPIYQYLIDYNSSSFIFYFVLNVESSELLNASWSLICYVFNW